MIVDIFITIINWVIGAFAYLLPSFSVWDNPSWSFDTMFIDIGSALYKLNFILAVDTFFQAVDYFIVFLIVYFSAFLVGLVINFFRGTDGIKL